jgi:DNA-binding transcriptional MocR family regulator
MLAPAEIVVRAADAITANVGDLPLRQVNLGVHALAHVERLAARARRITAGKRAQVEAWLATVPEIAWSGPTDGLFGLATVRGAADLLAPLEAAAAEHGVLAAPGAFFGVPNAFRLSWATLGGADLDEGLARLARVLRS